MKLKRGNVGAGRVVRPIDLGATSGGHRVRPSGPTRAVRGWGLLLCADHGECEFEPTQHWVCGNVLAVRARPPDILLWAWRLVGRLGGAASAYSSALSSSFRADWSRPGSRWGWAAAPSAGRMRWWASECSPTQPWRRGGWPWPGPRELQLASGRLGQSPPSPSCFCASCWRASRSGVPKWGVSRRLDRPARRRTMSWRSERVTIRPPGAWGGRSEWNEADGTNGRFNPLAIAGDCN